MSCCCLIKHSYTRRPCIGQVLWPLVTSSTLARPRQARTLVLHLDVMYQPPFESPSLFSLKPGGQSGLRGTPAIMHRGGVSSCPSFVRGSKGVVREAQPAHLASVIDRGSTHHADVTECPVGAKLGHDAVIAHLARPPQGAGRRHPEQSCQYVTRCIEYTLGVIRTCLLALPNHAVHAGVEGEARLVRRLCRAPTTADPQHQRPSGSRLTK